MVDAIGGQTLDGGAGLIVEPIQPLCLIASASSAVVSAATLSMACALLGLVVVARRWAFVGEGIAHAGFGGAGTAWMLVVFFPSLAQVSWLVYITVVVFCLSMAVAVGWLERSGRVNSDAAIGIFLVASLAWGFVAREVYRHFNPSYPPDWETYLFGQLRGISAGYALVTVMISIAVVLVVVALSKEILAYCFDPELAEVSGIPAAFIHYLLMILIALVIILGVRIAGGVLVTAMLVLPAVTARMLAQRLRSVVIAAMVCGVLGAMAGLAVNHRWSFLPAGPSIVLMLFAQFLLAYGIGRLRWIGGE